MSSFKEESMVYLVVSNVDQIVDPHNSGMSGLVATVVNQRGARPLNYTIAQKGVPTFLLVGDGVANEPWVEHVQDMVAPEGPRLRILSVPPDKTRTEEMLIWAVDELGVTCGDCAVGTYMQAPLSGDLATMRRLPEQTPASLVNGGLGKGLNTKDSFHAIMRRQGLTNLLKGVVVDEPTLSEIFTFVKRDGSPDVVARRVDSGGALGLGVATFLPEDGLVLSGPLGTIRPNSDEEAKQYVHDLVRLTNPKPGKWIVTPRVNIAGGMGVQARFGDGKVMVAGVATSIFNGFGEHNGAVWGVMNGDEEAMKSWINEQSRPFLKSVKATGYRGDANIDWLLAEGDVNKHLFVGDPWGAQVLDSDGRQREIIPTPVEANVRTTSTMAAVNAGIRMVTGGEYNMWDGPTEATVVYTEVVPFENGNVPSMKDTLEELQRVGSLAVPGKGGTMVYLHTSGSLGLLTALPGQELDITQQVISDHEAAVNSVQSLV